ncbi:MAG: hypothetical protein M1571_09460 [Firmicutes bacterium]|nr:hypothetical protein [Bacillota bacterium]
MDKVIAGSTSGLIAGATVGAAASLFNLAGLTNYSPIQIAGGVFTGKVLPDPIPLSSLLVAWSSHFVISVAAGVLLAYLLFYTGGDYGILKGILLGVFFWYFNFGIVAPLLSYTLLPPMNYTDLLISLARHAVFGALAAWLLLRFFRPVSLT